MRALIVASTILALLIPASSQALVTCRDRNEECSLIELLQLNKDASTLGLSKAEHIAILLDIITQLRRIITTFQASSQVSYCVDLNHDMVQGSTDEKTDGEVSSLQSFLARSGAFTDAQITGFYGPLTAQAVLSWQKQQGMTNVTEKSGVGPLTREKIRKATCAIVE